MANTFPRLVGTKVALPGYTEDDSPSSLVARADRAFFSRNPGLTTFRRRPRRPERLAFRLAADDVVIVQLVGGTVACAYFRQGEPVVLEPEPDEEVPTVVPINDAIEAFLDRVEERNPPAA